MSLKNFKETISPVQKSRAHLAGGEKRSGVIWAEISSSNVSFKESRKGERKRLRGEAKCEEES